MLSSCVSQPKYQHTPFISTIDTCTFRSSNFSDSDFLTCRIYEDELQAAIEARTESLQTLRELGPPDLVHLIKQPIKSTTKQIGVYHHVSGIDASSSASLAAYINTLTYSPHDKQHKVVSGLYWYAELDK